MKFSKKPLGKKIEKIYIYFAARPFWAAVFFVVLTWICASTAEFYIERNAEGKNISSLEDAIWWGIVTMLTVGYGDRYPVTFVGRVLGGFVMIVGVIGIAIVTAKISSYFLERALRERRGLVDSDTLSKHLLICGWKTEMSSYLLGILDSNPQLQPADLVLLNNVPDTFIENLYTFGALSGVRHIRGDFFTEASLKRAAPDRAKKIVILADATPSSNGNIPTITEADARTVMTAMTLSNIAKGIPVAAEILDSSMDQYLRLAQVNEIIYTREYARCIVAMASTGTGVTNVYHDLLSTESPHFIGTVEIPAVLINKTYGEIRSYFEMAHSKMTLIGILENSGNSFVAKENALRKAQQTPNIQELVKNLQSVKALKFNKPTLCPRSDFVVHEGSLAIVIEERDIQRGA